MEDLDPPREQPGAAQSILHSLQAHNLHWDEEPVWQSKRSQAYDHTLAELHSRQLLFFCNCTRAMLGPQGSCNGRCELQQEDIQPPVSYRLKVKKDSVIRFTDRLQGPMKVHLGRELSDYTVRRKDGLYAYQLAVVVDDAAQGITHIVRGSDLLDSTARQIYLQQQLQAATPTYLHLPVIANEQGQKFSKQNHAPALDDSASCDNLRLALRFLRQAQPPEHAVSNDAILRFAAAHWSPSKLPAVMSIPASTLTQ
jgi:glutamyl-Q tRNA(Asp) synthetase